MSTPERLPRRTKDAISRSVVRAMTDTPRPPMTQSEPVLTALRDAADRGHGIRLDADEVRALLAAQSPVQPVPRASWDHDIVAGQPTTFDVTPLLDVQHYDEDDSWAVSIRAMPGHVGAADTLDQAVVEAADAAEAWVEAIRQFPVQPVLSGLDALPRLRLTGEQLNDIDPDPESPFIVDWDEYDEFVRLDDVRRLATAPAADAGRVAALERLADAALAVVVLPPHINAYSTEDRRRIWTDKLREAIDALPRLANPATPKPEQDR